MKSKTIIYLMILIQLLNNQCDLGCLKCDEIKKECQICDGSDKLLMLKDGKCVPPKIKIPDCETMDSNGKCILCDAFFFLEENINKCMPIAAGNPVENCVFYVEDNECRICKEDYFLNSNVCIKFPNPIQNCSIHVSTGVCGECKSGFLKSTDGLSCIKNPEIPKCVTYSNIACQACKSEAIPYKNYMLYTFQGQLKSYDKLIHFLIGKTFLTPQVDYEEGCVSGTVENCTSHTFTDPKTCLNCKDGYLLTQNKCVPYPVEKIPNCARYQNETTCLECIQKFFLKSPTECAVVEPIQNCELYSTTENKTQCTLCFRSHFLFNNTCVKRTNLVDLCSYYSLDSDVCTTCFDNHRVTSDGKRCLPTTNNCSTYETSSVESTALVCKQCQDLYYLFNGECYLGSVSNCETYQTSSNVCAKCKNGFYLEDDKCLKHLFIDECLIYDPVNSNQCAVCDDESMMMTKTTTCTKGEILGCQIYLNINQCSSCYDGYDKISNYECVKLEPFLNCKRAVNGVCTLCEENFLLQNGVCRRPYDYEVKFCGKTNIDGLMSEHSSVNCEVCLPDSIAMNYKNHFVCIQNAQMEILLGTYLTPNCLNYQQLGNGSNYECVKCQKNFVLQDGVCKNSCENNENLQKYVLNNQSGQYSLIKKNVCVSNGLANCTAQTIGTTAGNLVDYCYKTADTHYDKVTLNESGKEYYLAAEDIEHSTESKNTFIFPDSSRVVKANEKFRGEVIEILSPIDDCRFYYDLHDNWVGCMTCQFKKYGRIFNWKVDYCEVYDNTNKVCQTCMHTYYLENPLRCTKQPEIPGCQRYSKTTVGICRNCNSGFFLTNGGTTCTARSVIQNCELYSEIADKCLKCNPKFVLIDTNTPNACFPEIDNCDTYNPASNTYLECNICKIGFYPGTDRKTCQHGTLPDCWLYKQNVVATMECDKFRNGFFFTRNNSCISPTPIDGCITYASATTCEICNNHTHYLTTNTCCPYGQYYNGTSCTNSTINCKVNTTTTATSCNVCDDGYTYSTEGSKCCLEGSSYISGNCTLDFSLVPNNNCLVFDQKTKTCVLCKVTFYLTQKFGTCIAIPLTNCNHMDSAGNCLECSTGNPPHCCASTDYYNGTGCVALPANCLEMENNAGTWVCKTCAANFYKIGTSHLCCATTTQFYNGTACTSVTTIPNCVKYNSATTCYECATDYNVTSAGAACNNTNPTLNTFLNLIRINADVCISGYYMNNGKCVPYGSHNNAGTIATTTITNCKIVNDTISICNECNTNYFVANSGQKCCEANTIWDSTNSLCVPIEEYSLNCAYFNTSTKSCSTCAASDGKRFYKDGATQKRCCPEGQFWDGTLGIYGGCKATTAPNCSRQTAATTTCTKCKALPQTSATCSDNTGNCLQTQSNSTTCIKCNDTYNLLFYDTCATGCASNIITPYLKYCKKIHETIACGCDSCNTFAALYNDATTPTYQYCCPHGYYFKASGTDETGAAYTINRCIKITLPNCASSKDGVNCDMCFVKKDFCSTQGTNNWRLGKSNYSQSYSTNINDGFVLDDGYLSDLGIIDNFSTYEETYLGSDTKQCCPLGKYYKDGVCVDVTIPNCYKMENGLCIMCKEEYNRKNGNKICCRYDEDYNPFYGRCTRNISNVVCGAGEYLSNGVCCLERFYYDKLDGRCRPLLDPNCLRSDYKFTCGICSAGNKLEPNFATLIYMKEKTPGLCRNIDEKYYVRLCIDEIIFGTAIADANNTNTLIDYDRFTTLINDCVVFDFTNKKCTNCKSEKYKADDTTSNYCCAEGLFEFGGRCRKIQNFIENCSNYDHVSRKCLSCKNGTNLSEGVCCPQGYYLNKKTWQCDIQFPNCKTFDVFSGACFECLDLYYMSNGVCCQLGSYYDTVTKTCNVIGGNNCKKLDVFGQCDECSDDNYYLSNGFCCPFGKYYDVVNSVCTTLAGDFGNCKKYDEFGHCYECNDNYYLNLTKCCPKGSYYNVAANVCTYYADNLNCEEFGSFDNRYCTKCKTTYYLSNGICCLESEAAHISGNVKICLPINYNPNCLKVEETGGASVCLLCKPGFYITFGKCCRENFYYDSTTGGCIPISLSFPCSRYVATGYAGCTKSTTNNVATNDSTATGSGYLTFDSSAHPANCDQVSATTPANCVICSDGYYLAGSSKCCLPGKFWDSVASTPACVNITITDCTKVDNTATGKCVECSTGKYIYQKGSNNADYVCKAYEAHDGNGTNTAVTNCSQFKPQTDGTNPVNCAVCKDGFNLSADFTSCTDLSDVYPTYQADCAFSIVGTTTSCNYCYNDKYLVNNACCDIGKTFYMRQEIVDSSDPRLAVDCFPIDVANDHPNCIKYDAGNCQACQTGFYLTNSHCCQENFVYRNFQCEKLTSSGLAQCKRYDNETACNVVAGCLNNTTHYIHKNHCCPNGEYWNTDTSSCTSIGILNTNCTKLDDYNKCILCSSGYVSNGICCADGTYGTGSGSCSAIQIPNCTQSRGGVCITCSVGSSVTSSGCCSGYYLNTTLSCSVNPTNCSDVKPDGTCTACSTGYVTNGKCCNNGSYWNGTSCVTIPILNCSKTQDISAGQTPTTCTLCNTNYEVRSGKCCNNSNFFISNVCVSIDLFYGRCLQMDKNGLCKKCTSNYYPSEGVCCEIGESLSLTSGVCVTISQANCVQYSQGACQVCQNNYYLNSNISKCCEISKPHSGLNCSATATVTNCNNFSAAGVCQNCAPGFVLYTNNAPSGVCCSEKEYYDGTICQSLVDIDANCREFDRTNMICLFCHTDYYLANKHCCLKETEYWDLNLKKCVSQTLENCLKELMIIDNSGTRIACTECTNPAHYLVNEGCCPLNYYWNTNTKKCQAIPILNCQKYDDVTDQCLECFTDYNLYATNTICCPNERRWNDSTNSCEERIKNCKIYDDIVSNAQSDQRCKICTNAQLSVDRTSCCPDSSVFYDVPDVNLQCKLATSLENKLVFEYCNYLNVTTLQCQVCEPTHYVSHGICCLLGQKMNATTHLCENQSTPTNCNKWADGSGVTNCAGCVSGFALNSSNNSCVAIFPDCLTFDPTTPACTACDKNTYLSDGYCCAIDNRRVSGQLACEVIPTNLNCSKMTGGNCSLCKDGFYMPVTTNFCCQDGYYCADSSTSVAGTIKDCEQYLVDGKCSKCNSQYSLGNYNNSAASTFCYPVNIIDCESNALNQNNSNHPYQVVNCTTCKTQKFNTGPANATLDYKSYPTIYGCQGHTNVGDITWANLYQSDLKCYECDEDKFIDFAAQTCTLRTNIANCKLFERTADQCRSCVEGYYLNGSKQCVAHDSVLTNCLYHKDSVNDCAVCKYTYYEHFDFVTSNWNKVCELITDFSGENTEATEPTYYKGYMKGCIENEECSSEYLNGLPVELSKYVSCHKCVDTTRIPFISLKGTTNIVPNQGIQRFNILTSNTSTLDTYDFDNHNFSNQCLKVDLSEFSFATTANFPANCALGIINSNLVANASQSNDPVATPANVSVYCGACNPGYFPSYANAITPFFVYRCDPIANCSSSGSAFNQCDDCGANFAFEYKNASGINFSKCISNSNYSNCYAFNSDTNNCQECKNGYSKNAENRCELINAPFCEEGSMNFNKTQQSRDILINLYRGEFGCSKCVDNFAGIYRNVDEWVCTESSYVKKRVFASPPLFDVNCVQYLNTASNSFKCFKCVTTHILGVDGKCYNKTNLTNCLIANTASTCKTCVDTHVLVNNTCTEKTIKNCQTYLDPSAVLTCQVCDEKYYLLNNTCVLGEITNCLVYTDKTTCAVCDSGFQKILLKNSLNYCIPITTHVDCVQFDQTAFQNHSVVCTQCRADYVLQSLEVNRKVCNRFNLISNCAIYDTKATFGLSTLTCVECGNGFYLDNNLCIMRTKEIAHCKQYEISLELCKECEEDFYLNPGRDTCIANPVGVIGCAIYEEETKCIKCKNSFYLEANECKLVTSGNQVEFCEAYSNASTCERCQADKFLNSSLNVCEDVTVTNCKVLEDKNNCKECNIKYGIKEVSGVKTCVLITEIAECVAYDVDPFPCKQCSTDHYLSNNSCLLASPPIEHCLDYETNDLCAKCQNQFYLTKDKKCKPLFSRGLCQAFVESNPFCVLCEPGYILDETRNCIPDPLLDLKKNCLLYNSVDPSLPCEICKFGHYQNYEGECISNTFDPSLNITDANVNDLPPEFQKGSTLLKLGFYYFFLLLLVKLN